MQQIPQSNTRTSVGRVRGCSTRGKEGLQKGPTCVVIHHDDFKTSSDDFVELYAVKHYLKVTEEGSPEYFFDHPNTELADEEGRCIIDSVNDKLISEQRLTHGEFLWWIGVWVLISTVDGSDQRAFWLTKKVDVFDGAPFRVTPYMSRHWFAHFVQSRIFKR